MVLKRVRAFRDRKDEGRYAIEAVKLDKKIRMVLGAVPCLPARSTGPLPSSVTPTPDLIEVQYLQQFLPPRVRPLRPASDAAGAAAGKLLQLDPPLRRERPRRNCPRHHGAGKI